MLEVDAADPLALRPEAPDEMAADEAARTAD
jgi:hypothetical protein